LIAPAKSSEKDLKVEQVGLEATGFAITTLSASLISIFNCVSLVHFTCVSVCKKNKIITLVSTTELAAISSETNFV